jgi:RHS repeat-associated protein
MGARFYASDLGAWTSGDPLAVNAPEQLVGVDFAAANPYAYAKDSPLLAADRDGHFWHVAFGAAAGFLIGGTIEAGRQYLEYGKIESWGRVGGAALGGGVSGAIIAANPAVGLGSIMGTGAVAGTAEGVTTRLVASGGHDAGTLKEAFVDGTVGGLTAGALHGGAKLVKAVIRKAPSAARALTSKVGAALEGHGACPCFAAGTLVATARGPVPIEALRPGEFVTSRDETTGETTTRPISQVFVTPDKEVLDLSFAHLDGTFETITATPGHPFWVEGTGWVEARDLALGAPVQTAESGLATLSATLSREERTTVYNLEVEGTHTYFVGETKAWVHNACGCIPNEAHVVRGGIATPEQISSGIAEHRDVPGLVGFSAQSRAGASVEELAMNGGKYGGPFPNGKISVTTAGKLRCIGCDVVPSPGAGANHVTVQTNSVSPTDISAAFEQLPNPGK